MAKSRSGVAFLLLICLIVGAYFYMTRCRGEAADRYGEGGQADRPKNGTATSSSVDFRDDMSPAAVAALGEKLNVEFKPASSQVGVDEIYEGFTFDGENALRALEASPDVEAADYEAEYTLPEAALAEADEGIVADADAQEKGFPNDPKFKYQWHLQQIHMMDTWKAAQGEGVIVAVIDTGVAKVPDLEQTQIVPGYNFVANTADATDDHGHGTHVAGTIAQSTHNGVGVAGVAFKAKIMPIKVLSARGSGSVAGIAEGIRFAADHGAKVINMSLGGPMATSVLANAVKYAHDKGVTVICAAGNDGKGKVSYPAAYKHAIAVAATQFDESTTFYSNWGKEIDIAAPGGNTQVDQNGDGMKDGVLQNTIVPGNISKNDYLLFMGTSMAAPHVAGVAALIVGSGVSDPDAVEQILKETARKPAGKKDFVVTKGPENRYGAGIVDAAASVRKAQLGEGERSLGFAAGLAALVLLGLRRRALLGLGLGLGGVVGLVIASSGLFFLPQLIGTSIPGVSIASHGLASIASGNPLVMSALIPLLLVLVGYGFVRRRGLLAGFSLGWAGYLAAHAIFRTVDVAYLPAAFDGIWLAVNALILVVTARAVLRK